MLFQILDDKQECFGVYSNGNFIYDRIPDNVTGTWNWDRRLSNSNIRYASIYSGGQSLSSAAPEDLRHRLQKREDKIRGFINSALNAKVKLDELCMFDLVPEQHLMHYCEIKNEICDWVFKNNEHPKNHGFLVDLHQMAHNISKNPVLIDQKALKNASKTDLKARALLNNLNGRNRPILYDVWGSKTGRLTTKQGSFPIMNLKKEIANCVVPKNDIFVQFDLNGAEIRTFISLSTGTHPPVDIHEWNMKNVLKGVTERDKAKKKFLAWFYNPYSDVIQSSHYDRSLLLNKYYKNGVVSTPFGREIKADDFHALNYLLQSSSSDNCMKQACKINKFLQNNLSFVHSVVHDSLTIDLALKDRGLLPQIQEIFEDTELGWFRSSVQVGRNLRDLEEVSWS
tara:strand:- start:106 stop:1296 length:1191 start_codon:yes stop_codon:yes gene_type:complete